MSSWNENPYASPEEVESGVKMEHPGSYRAVRSALLRRTRAGLGWTLMAVLLISSVLAAMSWIQINNLLASMRNQWTWELMLNSFIVGMFASGGMYVLGAFLCLLAGGTVVRWAPLLALGGLLLAAFGELFLVQEMFLDYGNPGGMIGIACMAGGAGLWCVYLLRLAKTLNRQTAALLAFIAVMLCVMVVGLMLLGLAEYYLSLLGGAVKIVENILASWVPGIITAAYVALEVAALVILRREVNRRVQRLEETGFEENAE